MDKYVELYYEVIHGVYPFDTDLEKTRTRKTIEYLIEAGISSKDIVKTIECARKEDSLRYENLPDFLWENSLLKKNVFYYHNELQIRSNAPSMNLKSFKIESTPFFIEMKIQYTTKDILNYLHKKTKMNEQLIDINKDTGAISYLLSQYKRFDFISPVDFILFLIDYAVDDDDCSLMSIFQIDSKYRAEVFHKLSSMTMQASANSLNIIIPR